MTTVLVLLALFALGLLAYLIRNGSERAAPPGDVDPEQAMKAAVELHRIRRNFDAAWTLSQQRRDGAALRREIARTLRDEDG